MFPSETLCHIWDLWGFPDIFLMEQLPQSYRFHVKLTRLSISPKCLFAWFPICSTHPSASYLKLGITNCWVSSRHVFSCWNVHLEDRTYWGWMFLQMTQAAPIYWMLSRHLVDISCSIILFSAPFVMISRQAKTMISHINLVTPTKAVSQGLFPVFIWILLCVHSLITDLCCTAFLSLHLRNSIHR